MMQVNTPVLVNVSLTTVNKTIFCHVP